MSTKKTDILISLNDVVGVSDIALEMVFYLGSVCDIAACGGVSKMYSYIFLQRMYDGKSLVNKIIFKNFLSRLGKFFPLRSSKVNGDQDIVALSFCRFLSQYEYCFSGSGVLASMTGIGIGDVTWEWRNPYRKIDVYIRERPHNFAESLAVWVENMGEYLEMDMSSFEFSPGETFFRRWVPDSIFNFLFKERGEWYTNTEADLDQFINFHFLKEDVDPKDFILNRTDLSIVSNWIVINANGVCDHKIGNLRHLCRKAGKVSAFYRSEFQEDWNDIWKLERGTEHLPSDADLRNRCFHYESRGYRFYGSLPRNSFDASLGPFVTVLEDGDSDDDVDDNDA